MSILSEIVMFSTSSIVSGITWDILKKEGKKIIYSFKKRFIENKCFDEENECEECLKRLVLEESISKSDPYASAILVYKDISGKRTIDKFKVELEEWIGENKKELEDISSINRQIGSIKIGKQINKGFGKIINAGVYNEFNG